MALPAGFGTPAHPRLLVQTGKDGRVYLLDRDNLGGNAQGPAAPTRRSAAGRAVQRRVGPPRVLGRRRRLRLPGREPGLPARVQVRRQRQRPAGAQLGRRPARRRSATPRGRRWSPRPAPRPGSAIVWVVYSDGSNGANGQLRAYDALPVSGQLQPALLGADRHRDQVRRAGHRRRPGLRRHPRRQDLRLRPADHRRR